MERRNEKSISPYLIFDIFRYSKLGIRYFNNRGFTIIETLVAVAVLMLAVTAPLTLAERALSSAEVARREVTAFYLAQEAIEYVRNVKDANAVFGYGGKSTWLSGLTTCTQASGCGIDPTSDVANSQIVPCDAAHNLCVLSQNDATRIFGYILGHTPQTGVGWTTTEFKRVVSVNVIDTDKEAKITATVSWGVGTPQGRTITVTSNIFNWYVSP